MKSVVGIVRGKDKTKAFSEILQIAGFDKTLNQAFISSGKSKTDFRIVIKPNIMVFVSHAGKEAIITDPELVEQLVDHLIGQGFTNIALCESQHDVAKMFKNHNVAFVSEMVGYRTRELYRIADLTLEKKKFHYRYLDGKGRSKVWKDFVGLTWRDADFRISFAKCKTHELDYLTLSLKNTYGCMPHISKIWRYHIRNEVEDVTARSLANFPVHFAFVDAWIGSDGFQGYKIAHPQPLRMLFGGNDPIAVDMEVFKRAGLDWRKSQLIGKCIEQVHYGQKPEYDVTGDSNTFFRDIVDWQNIADETVEDTDFFEEIYLTWPIINLKPGIEHFDHSLFPPKNFFWRAVVWFSEVIYSVFKLTSWFKRWYRRKLPPDELGKIEDGEFDTAAIFAIVWTSLKKLGDKASVIIWTSLVGLMVWGFHGKMDILHALLDKRFGPDWTRKITLGLAWGEQLVSFVVGFLFAVILPCLVIKFGFRENLKDYGLGLPGKNDRHKSWVIFWSLFGFTALFILLASFRPDMQMEYPLFGNVIMDWGNFIVYEIAYLIFFVSIEFAFRGYLLFGLHRIRMPWKSDKFQPPLRFGTYAILIQMLAYTTWHYGKPVPEMIGTLVWGVVAAAVVLRIRSLWPVIAAHWLYNVLLDFLIWKDIPEKLKRLF